MNAPVCHEINLSRAFGGGEVYTRAFTRALLARGVPVRLYVDHRATHWDALTAPGLDIVRIGGADELPARLPSTASWIVTHTPTSKEFLAWAGAHHVLSGFAHMPTFGRDLRRAFADYRLVIPVSDYVRRGLLEQGVAHVHDAPLYCSIELEGRDSGEQPILRGSPYDWDRRKVRDRCFGVAYRLTAPLRKRQAYSKPPGLTLGIVSLLAPIKQFPELLSIISPIIARYPDVTLDIFGSGGYSTVRDIGHAVRPLGARARFWGMQSDVGSVYRKLDWLLSGLPEKEALGLNLLEAQACNTPVLAVDAAPFRETVADGRSGFLYRDPREDGGAGFRQALERAIHGEHPSPRRDAADHLERFAFPAFVERVGSVVERVRGLLAGAGR